MNRFEEAMTELNANRKALNAQIEALEWRWVEMCPELFGSRDIPRELELRRKQLARLKCEYVGYPKSKAFERMKTGQTIKEVKEIISTLEKAEANPEHIVFTNAKCENETV